MELWIYVVIGVALVLAAGGAAWWYYSRQTPSEPFSPQALGDVDTMESTSASGWWPHYMWPVHTWPLYGTYEAPIQIDMLYVYWYMRKKRGRMR